jgi:hypothetical protein
MIEFKVEGSIPHEKVISSNFPKIIFLLGSRVDFPGKNRRRQGSDEKAKNFKKEARQGW